MTRFDHLKLAAQEAAKAVRRGYSGSLPIPVEEIVRRHGIKVELVPLDDKLSGMSFVRNNVAAIILNANHHINRRRFTLCHELAHHILHEEYLKNNVHIDKKVLNRDEISAEGEDPKEIQANTFAAELLMPENEVLKIIDLDINDDELVRHHAKRFKVSTSALIYRLVNVGAKNS